MIPTLYDSTETVFETNGLGGLSDASSCVVTEERNGSYELEMEYPINGRHYNDIDLEKIIYAKPSDEGDSQPFCIYHISKPIDGFVTINARHISYRGCFIPVGTFAAQGAANALNGLITNSLPSSSSNPFTVWTDITNTTSAYAKSVPSSFRDALGGSENSILSIFNGEYEWDKFAVKLHANRGSNKGVTIAYSKNLTDLNQDIDNADVLTAVYPYWTDSDNTEVVTCGIIEATSHETYSYGRTIVKDFSSYFQSEPTSAELQEKAENYINNTVKTSRSVNLKISFAALWQTEEYKNIAPLERVSLCDTVTIKYTDIGVDATSKVIETEYDTLAERYISITLGDAKSNLSTTITENTPTNISDLTNDTGYTTATQVTSITNDTIATTNVVATNLKVQAANITGTLTASQIDATNLHVSSANITGTLTMGQLPSTVAETSDIPTDVSDLNNDAGYQNASQVTTITESTIQTTNVTAQNLKVNAANIGTITTNDIIVVDDYGNEIFSVRHNAV